MADARELELVLEMLQPSSWARTACASRLAHRTATNLQERFPLTTRAYRTLQKLRIRFHAGGSSLCHLIREGASVADINETEERLRVTPPAAVNATLQE